MCSRKFSLNSGVLFQHEYYPIWYDNAYKTYRSYDLQEYFASYIRLPLGISWIFRPDSKAKRSLGIAFNFDFLMQDKVNYAFAPSSGLHTKSYPLILDRIVPEISYARSWHLYKDVNLKFLPGVCLLPVFQKAHHEFIMTNISLCWRIMLEYKPNDSKK